MSHVDEGALHAYLDGALDEYPPAEAEEIRSHLDGCAECAARLEVERRVRSDAEAMLGLAAPVVDVPSFEELRAYVQRTRPERRRVSRIQRLGWAASVMLAIGAGWMLREGQLQTRMLDMGQDRVLAPAPDAGDGTPVSTPQGAVAESYVAPAERGAATDETVSTDLARQAVEEESAAVPAAFRAEAESAFAVQPAREGEGARVAEAAAPEPVDVLASADAPAAPPSWAVVKTSADRNVALDDSAAPLDDSTATPGAVSAARVAEVLIDTDTGLDAATNAAVTGAVAARREAVEARSRAPVPVPAPVVSELTVGAAEVQPRRDAATRDEADDEAPEPLLAVPGHEVIDVKNLGEGTTPWGTRTRQRMSDGRTFEIVHLEPGIDPSILPDLEADMRETRTETELGWVLVRGALSRPELDELMARLFPGED